MNRLVVVYLLELLCISIAPTKAERKVHCKIKEACIDYVTDFDRSSQTFNDGNVYLYKEREQAFQYRRNEPPIIEKYYSVRDNSDQDCRHFIIAQDNVAVTEDTIIVKYVPSTITLTLEGNTFAFYKDLFPREDFSHQYSVRRLLQGKNIWPVSIIRAKQVLRMFREWIFVALEGSAPRLIFTERFVKSTSNKNSDKEVTFLYTAKGETPTTIEFANSVDASRFYGTVAKL